MKHEIKAMWKIGGDAIANNSSMNGVVAIAHLTKYTASKHIVIGPIRGTASEARETGVRVTAVLPSLIVTPMIEKLRNNLGLKDNIECALERHSINRFYSRKMLVMMAAYGTLKFQTCAWRIWLPCCR